MSSSGFLAAFDDVESQIHKFHDTNLQATITEAESLTSMLRAAQDEILAASNTHAASLILTKLQSSVKKKFDTINSEALLPVDKAQKALAKGIDTLFPERQLPTEKNPMSVMTHMINRAITIQFLREGQMDICKTFLQELFPDEKIELPRPSSLFCSDRSQKPPASDRDGDVLMGDAAQDDNTHNTNVGISADQFATNIWGRAGGDDEDVVMAPMDVAIAECFVDWHVILDAWEKNDYIPAFAWAKFNRPFLDGKGSNLESELMRLVIISRLCGETCSEISGGNGHSHGHGDNIVTDSSAIGDCNDDEDGGGGDGYWPPNRFTKPNIQGALAWGRLAFTEFKPRHMKKLGRIMGSMAYTCNMEDSMYGRMYSSAAISRMRDEVKRMLQRDFFMFMGHAAESPLRVVVTASALAMPNLLKYMESARTRRTEWSTAEELPFPTTLPRRLRYHTIVVCPVSKAQVTQTNPAKVLPCGHVVSSETLRSICRNTGKAKCPYCPRETNQSDASTVFIM